jgi:phosphate transport system permease protein
MASVSLSSRTAGTFGDRAFRLAAVGAALGVLLILALIAISTTREAGPAFQKEGASFVTGTTWAESQNIFEAGTLIFGTMLASTIAIALGVPVAIGIALFTNEVAPRRARKPIVYILDLLAAVPSVVYGMWGIAVAGPVLLGWYDKISKSTSGVPVLKSLFAGPVSGRSFMTAGLILAIMISPIVTSIAREVFATVPQDQKNGALALGSTRWEMIRGVVLPHSGRGLVAAVILGLGRAMGETIAVALVIGGVGQITPRLFASGDAMAAIIANQFGEAAGVHRSSLIGLGVVLFVMTILVNVIAQAVLSRGERHLGAAIA